VLRRAGLLVTAALVLAAPAWASGSLSTRLGRALAAPHVSQALSGAIAVDLTTGRVVFARHASLSLEPASNEKLALTFAALVRLGAPFRFQTEVLGEGALDGDVWRGNLVLHGGGDPTLTTLGLERLAAQLRTHGVRHVTGAIVGDESLFDARRGVDGWRPSFYGLESPPLSALCVDRGEVRVGLARRPALVAAQKLRTALVTRGITVTGGARTGTAAGDAYPLALVESDPLANVLRFMDYESDNFTAELLLKELGAVVAGRGTSAAGAAVVEQTIADAGIPTAGLNVVDGSGLSRSDRLTARALAGILTAGWADPEIRRDLVAALPVAGVSGTLERRLDRLPARGRVRAKTGTTNIASALSGYVGRRYAFAIVQNGHPVWSWEAREAQDRFVQALAAAG
jgi:D-alanyl-D-alanine carboxypeptidase/D-alanyl-D-alanine-endopeptidase (penicillin-binding protein 4)